MADRKMKLVKDSVRNIDPVRLDDDVSNWRVFRIGLPSWPAEGWERRILELSDGMSVGEMVKIIYQEETSAGAWAADIATWRPLFVHSVVGVIKDMVDRGYVAIRQQLNGHTAA